MTTRMKGVRLPEAMINEIEQAAEDLSTDERRVFWSDIVREAISTWLAINRHKFISSEVDRGGYRERRDAG